MTGYLDLEAALATPFVHPGGEAATAYLLAELGLSPQQRALDLGCGAGATAAEATRFGAVVTGLDSRPAMLAAANRRTTPFDLVFADASTSLPFADASFDAAWAESVVALLEPRHLVPELLRIVRPGGRIALNERIWKPGTSAEEAARINTVSMRCFGIPAAAVEPRDRDGWVTLLEGSGLRLERVTSVDELLPAPRQLPRRQWLERQRRYLASPTLLTHSLRWRWLIRRHRELWTRLESWIFIGVRRS